MPPSLPPPSPSADGESMFGRISWKEGAIGVMRAIEDETLLGGEHLDEGKVGPMERMIVFPPPLPPL